jgi:hypothetical protein
LSEWQNYHLAELQEIARNNNIDTQIEKTRVKKDWEGQPKGLLQVLWERGWIDEGQLEKYNWRTMESYVHQYPSKDVPYSNSR